MKFWKVLNYRDTQNIPFVFGARVILILIYFFLFLEKGYQIQQMAHQGSPGYFRSVSHWATTSLLINYVI